MDHAQRLLVGGSTARGSLKSSQKISQWRQWQESLEPAVIAVHHAILCADEVGEQSAKEIVLQDGSPVRRALSDLAASPQLCYLQWYARADEYKAL